MVLHFDNREIDLDVSDNSYRYRAIKGEHNLTLYVSLPVFTEIPVGAWCEFQGEVYTLEQPENFKMNGKEDYEYTLILDSPQAKLRKYKFKNVVDRRLKFSYTGRPHEHLQLLVDNLNNRDSGWKVGECLEASEKTISYNHSFCNDALQMMADAFETEYEINRKTISLRKVEYNKENPLSLSYGRGKGFKTGICRENDGKSKKVEILFVQGGEKNIDASKYGSKELLLPKNQKLTYEGRTYIVDEDGFSIRRADKELQTHDEDSIDLTNIYPSRVGEISKVEAVNAGKNLYDIIDVSIPDSLDYSKYRVGGERATIVFQSGMLATKEFDIEQTDKALTGYVHSERRFKIVPQEIEGQTMPNETFCPRAGDKYAVFGCMLPDAYVCDNKSKTGASWDMFREAVKKLYDLEERHFSFKGELDGIWTKRDWLNIGGKIVLGGYVKFTADFIPEGTLIRIVGIKEFINNPYSPTIELSNVTAGSNISSDLLKIEQNEVVVENNRKELIQFAKRRFRDAQETAEMLEKSLLNFSGSISPVSVNAMQLIAGDKSLQFMFVNSKTKPVQVPHDIIFNPETKILTAQGGILKHMTLGITSLSSAHKPEEYRYWDIEAFTSPVLTDPQAYYLYVKVSKTGTTGVFYLSPTAIKMEDVEGYYHFLAGILNSEFNEERSWTQFYGFSETTPGQMLIERIISPDGTNYMDFVRNAFRIGNETSYLDWNNLEKDTLSTLKMKLQSAVIKDRLDVLGEAFLAGFLFSNEIIKSEKKVGNNPALNIDGKNGYVELNSTESIYTEYGGSKNIKKRITISSGEGLVETRNEDHDTAYISTQGIFANKAGINPLPSSTGIKMYASVAGLGFGKMDKGSWGENWCVCGVYGDSSNSSYNPTPAYGGFFRKLRANGLFLNVRQIDKSVTLNLEDAYVSCYNTEEITIYLPRNPYSGMVLIFRRMNPANFKLNGNGKVIHTDGGTSAEVWGKNGRGDTTILVFDGQYWNFNYWVR